MKLRPVPIAWLQLKHDKLRLAAAIAGISFAVVLIFMQLGFQAALFDSSVRIHRMLQYDLMMVSPKTVSLLYADNLPRRRLRQVAGFDQVAWVTEVYADIGYWQDPQDTSANLRSIFIIGFNPSARGFENFVSREQRELIKRPDTVLFDRQSRQEYGPVLSRLASGPVPAMLNGRSVEVGGTFDSGVSFGINGSIITSDLNYQRMVTDQPSSHINLGLIRLVDGADVATAAREIRAQLPADVSVYTREAFIDKEIAYWNGATAVGFVFSFGVVIGLIVGLVIVYQILFADVQDHLGEYATLKAMGFRRRFLNGLVMKQALLLSLAGFVPGALLACLAYQQAAEATHLPIEMTATRALTVLVMATSMCMFSGLMALRRLRAADPAEVF